jgi:uncharacterized protein
MTRALFWLALVILIIFAVRSKLRKLNRGQRHAQDEVANARAQDEGAPMACCAHCRVYFPASEAIRSGGLEYCSAAHVGLPGQ